MKNMLFSAFLAIAMTGASFGQAGKTQDQKSKDDTNFQKGNPDPADPANPQTDDQKKKGKDKSGKNKNKGPIDPNNPNNPPKGNGPTVPAPTPTPTPSPTK